VWAWKGDNLVFNDDGLIQEPDVRSGGGGANGARGSRIRSPPSQVWWDAECNPGQFLEIRSHRLGFAALGHISLRAAPSNRFQAHCTSR
jgi:hypothetical protein